jgi:transglutaminase-like putative cysteine protease/tetratricopeptide (TPR) repeat protein
MPLLAAATSATDPSAGAAAFWGVIILLVAARRARAMREPGANRKGHTAGLLLYVAWASTTFGYFLTKIDLPLVAVLPYVSTFVLIVLGVFLAISALLEIRADPARYGSGKAQAVRALVSAGIFVSLLSAGAYAGFRRARGELPLPALASSAQTSKAPVERPDLNFRIQPLPRPWVEMDAKKFNRQASVLFGRTRPEVYFMVIAEKIGEVEITPQAMLETWKAGVESVSAKSSFLTPRPAKVFALDALRAGAQATLGSLELAYVNVALAHNGFAYQLVAWSDVREEADLNRQMDALVAAFELIDPSRRAQSPRKPAAAAFASKDFGYTIDLAATPWTEWRSLAERVPRAEFGALCGDNWGMAIEPVPLLGHKPPAADADRALLSLMDLHEEKPLQRASLQRGAWRGFDSSYERAVDGMAYRYRVWTLLGPDAVIFAAEWRVANAPADGCASVLDKLVLGRAAAIGKNAVPRPAAVAHFFNEMGLVAFRDGRFAQAREAFAEAHALGPQEPAYVRNVVGSLRREGKKEAALDWLGRQLKGASCSSPLRATYASNLADLGKVPEALATWTELFACGYLDDEAFDEYARFLESHGKADLALREAADYAGRSDSVSIALLRAELLSRKGERDKGIALLEERQKKKGFDSGVAFRLADMAIDAERPAEAVRLCEEMVSRGFASKDLRVLQARAEYQLKWYARAKGSLELALKADPSDEKAQRFLEHVSAVLGEGKNSAVKDPIEPVPLPAALAAAAPEPADRGHSASYGLRATAISFVRGQELRTTEYRRIRVLDETGVNRFSTFDFRFDPLSEALYLNKVEVKDASGAVVTASASEAYLSDEASGEMGTQRRILFVPVPGLRPGSTIELVLTRRELVPPDRMEFSEHPLSLPYPVARSALFVRGDVGQVESRTTPGLSPRQLPEGVAWVVESPPVYRWEPLQPAADEFLPTVWLGDARGSWEAVGKEYLRSVGKLLTLDPAVREVAKKADRSPAALVRFVQKELTYKAIEFGRGARIPRQPADVLRRRYGDCKDHALLLSQLLGAVGVPARLALVRTGGPLRREMPSLDQFDHMVVYLPAQDLFIDATNKSADLYRGVTTGIAGKDALVLDPKQPRVVHIPEQGDDAGEMSLVREAHLVQGADLEVSETATYRGNEAAMMRAYFDDLEPKVRASAFQRRLSGHGHEVAVLSLDVRDLRDPQKPLAVQLKYVQRGAFRAVGGQLVGKLPALLERGRLEVEADERETPFQFRLPLRIHSTVSLELPSGYSPAQPLAARASADGRFAGWRVSSDDAPASRELRARFDYGRKRGRHAPSEYADLRRDTEAALGALEQEVVLQRVAVGRAE